MKEQEVLILVFVVLVIAVVMMKSTKSDTKPSGGGTPTPPTLESLKIDGQFVTGFVLKGYTIKDNEVPKTVLFDAGDSVRVTFNTGKYIVTRDNQPYDTTLPDTEYGIVTLDEAKQKIDFTP